MASNPFDSLGEKPEWSEDDKESFERLDYLIHKIFVQTDEGEELITKWSEHLLMSPTASVGDDLLTIGMQEGVKTFIRNILLTIRKVENE